MYFILCFNYIFQCRLYLKYNFGRTEFYTHRLLRFQLAYSIENHCTFVAEVKQSV